tara:strand:- start:2472 stop:3527 length:1056 start_codon:yes stop_codon:yes gene_type:complete
MGKVLGGGGKQKPAKPYAAAQFKPYTYTSQLGSTAGATTGGDGFNVTSQLNPSLIDLGQSGLGSAQPFLEQYLAQAGQQTPMFGYGDTGEQRAADIFRTQSALLQPEFAQQRQQLSNDLFGSGRLGLQLSGEAAGAGIGGGMVQPDAFGLARAQSMSLADLAGLSRERGMLEQQQGYEQALGSYDVNQQARQQQLGNLMGGFTTSLGAFGTVSDLEQSLVNAGLTIEQARSAAQASSAGAGASLAQAGTPAKNSFFQDLLLASASGASSAATTAAMAPAASDVRLKTNIRKVGELASGLNTYFWDWTEEAKQFVGNQNTFGVIAQEAQLLFPEAIMMHPDGYLRVDYSRIA